MPVGAPVREAARHRREGMSRLFFGLLVIGFAVLQATVLPDVGPVVVMPNLVLVLILVRTVQAGVADGLLWSLVAGLALDMLALDPLGSNALALLPVVLAGAIGRKRIFLNGVLFPMVLAVVGTLGYALVLNLVRLLVEGTGVPFDAVMRLSLLQALMNAVLVPLVWPLVGLFGTGRAERVS
jgi:rod shape-determining protein MreD